MKRTVAEKGKRVAAGLLAVCLLLSGCGGKGKTLENQEPGNQEAEKLGPEDVEKWTDGIMRINGSIVVIGEITGSEFMEQTGFDEVIEKNEYDDYTNYILSDGYSTLKIRATANTDVVHYLDIGESGMDGDSLVDTEHTTITGPGGITIGVSTVEEMVAYASNMENAYDSYINEQTDYCEYVAALQSETNPYDTMDGYLYSTTGGLDDRIVIGMLIKIGAYDSEWRGE